MDIQVCKIYTVDNLYDVQMLVLCSYEEYVPLKKRRQLEQEQRQARLAKVTLVATACVMFFIAVL